MKAACYITYYGLSESLLWSQGIPYLKGVAEKTGTKFHIVSFEKKELINQKGVKKQIEEQLDKIGFQWWSLPYHHSFAGKLWDILVGNIVCVYLLLKNKIAVFHARWTMGYAFLLLVSCFGRVKILFDLRGIMAEEYVDAGFWSSDSLTYHLVKKMEEKGLKRADAVVVLSHRIKQTLVNGDYYSHPLPSEKIKVIYCAVDTSKFFPKNSNNMRKKLGLNGKLVLIYLGSVGTWYLFEEMLDFFSCLKHRFPHAHFLAVTHSDKSILLEKIKKKQLNLDDFTILYSKPEDVPLYLDVADIGISFIKQCLSKTASCPTKIGEYMASGLPVLTNSGIGDVDIFITKYQTGLLFKELSHDYFIKKCDELDALITDKFISERARTAAMEIFSLEGAIEQYTVLHRNFLLVGVN